MGYQEQKKSKSTKDKTTKPQKTKAQKHKNVARVSAEEGCWNI